LRSAWNGAVNRTEAAKRNASPMAVLPGAKSRPKLPICSAKTSALAGVSRTVQEPSRCWFLSSDHSMTMTAISPCASADRFMNIATAERLGQALHLQAELISINAVRAIHAQYQCQVHFRDFRS